MSEESLNDLIAEVESQILGSSGYISHPYDATKLISMLGGDMKVKAGMDVGAVCYYITLLIARRQLNNDP